MHVLGNSWREGYLDYWRDPERHYRIDVRLWALAAPVDGQYIVRAPAPRMVWHYVRRIGPVAVLRKIRSRLAEAERNQKYAAIGMGTIVEAPLGSACPIATRVLFFAANHPRCASRVSIECPFVIPWAGSQWVSSKDGLHLIDFFDGFDVAPALTNLCGWSQYSSSPIEEQQVKQALVDAHERMEACLSVGHPITVRLDRPDGAIHERTEDGDLAAVSGCRVKAVLFGLGNYAKTQILPNLDHAIRINCVHEIDPQQIGTKPSRWAPIVDTSPWPRAHEKYDAWFIAGFHHTHALLAAHALRAGAYAVVEKPIATTWPQLSELREALEASEVSRIFSCFHKRYSSLNKLAISDLGVTPGDAVNYHCIVYEIPLPRRHWYNWPNSRSRLTSNGCHWIDHFLWLNAYSAAVDTRLHRARNGDLLVFVELENGASFSMILTEVGSERIGVRDYVELRAGKVTAKMIDSANYEAESTTRILCRKRVNPMQAYKQMYRSISRAIVDGRPGDAVATLRSTELTLRLEDELARL